MFAGVVAVVGLVLLVGPAYGGQPRCAPDAAPVGPVCVDRYEASVWAIPPASKRLIGRVRAGKAGLTDLVAGGDPNLPGGIIRGGNFATGTRNGVFAVFAGVNPSNISRSTGFRCAR